MGLSCQKYVANVDLDHQSLWSFKSAFNFILKAAREGAILISRLNWFRSENFRLETSFEERLGRHELLNKDIC